jgi:hypothetical protein
VNVLAVIVEAVIEVENVAWTVVSGSTPVALAAGAMVVTVGAAEETVVNDQVCWADSAVPSSERMPVVSLAV